MKNPMLNQLNKQAPTNPLAMIKEFQQFKQQMIGKDPQQIVYDLLNSGKMTQEQFEQLKTQAEQFSKFLR